MVLTEVKKMAKANGVKLRKLKKADLIKAIQEAEGNDPCFKADFSPHCTLTECLWHPDCVRKKVN